MNILVTNDDGYGAPGLLILKQALEKVGTVVVVAPDQNWSAGGHVKTLHKPLRLSKVQLADGSEAYASSGAPSDCVALALLGAIDFKPDLIVSGINPFPNLSHDVTYSGTVTAAMEGALSGIPSIAVSVEDAAGLRTGRAFAAYLAPDRFRARPAARCAAQRQCAGGPDQGRADHAHGSACLSTTNSSRASIRAAGPTTGSAATVPTGIPDDGTDVGALHHGYISVTPDPDGHDGLSVHGTLKTWELQWLTPR